MYNRIFQCFTQPLRGKILGVSGISNFYSLFDAKNSEITDTSYPDVDLQNLPFDDNAFDFLISDQVIEHLKDPQKAVNESYRVLKTGGIVIHTTCFMNYIHANPNDFWRFSPDALRLLCGNFSEIIQCEGFGNRLVHVLCFANDRFRALNVPDTKFSLLHHIATWNEIRYPIVTWVVAKK